MLSAYIYVSYLIIEEGLNILQGKAFKPANKNTGDEHGKFVVSVLQHHRHIQHMNYQRR